MRAKPSRDALSGAVAAALGLGASELAAGVFALPSLIGGVGDWVIDVVPTPVKDWAIQTFGTADKLVLLVGITLTALLLGSLAGLWGRRRFGIPVGVFLGFGLVAAVAAVEGGGVELGMAVIPGGLAAIAGLGALHWLYRLSSGTRPEGEAAPGVESPSRRAFLLGLGAVAGLAALSAALGRSLLEQAKRVAARREEVSLPVAAEVLPPVPNAADLEVTGLGPILTSNPEFYRIDTAFLSVPEVNLEEWRLSFTGMVDRPYSLSYADLLEMRLVERDVTLACVSNRVGGDLVGNARWLGVPLVELLDRAGVQPGAEQVVGRSVDDFTVGFPVEAAYDGREALVAVGMNGEPLPFVHGFPARLVVAGLYGYVSATKWLASIELTTWDGFDAYWVPRGWAKEGPIKTQSRIDTPRIASGLDPGTVTVAGVAWAPTRGISKVEVQLGDQAAWVEAELSEPLSVNSWVQWRTDWAATPGTHRLRVRATDGEGVLQPEEIRPPAPDGATGWHSISVTVRSG